MTSLLPLVAHAFKMQEAALYLIKNDFRLAALMLVFTTIDQMAWISLPGDEDVRGNDFVAWVDTYMLGRNRTGLEAVTAGDLYGARCGLLHTGTAESHSLRNGKASKKIAYSYGPMHATSLVSEWTFIRFEDLVNSLLAGILWFKDDLDADEQRASIANAKVARMLLDHPV
jgi:hypothetical protein